MHHRIAATGIHPWKICVSPEAFAEQLARIQAPFHPLSLGDLTHVMGSKKLPPNAVSVTFDNGYLDNMEAAGPLPHKYQVRATLFVATRSIVAKAFRQDRLDPIFYILVSFLKNCHWKLKRAIRKWTWKMS